MQNFLLIILIFSISSCGRKGVVMEPSSMGIVDSLVSKKDIINIKEVNDKVCIDDILKIEMNEKESIKKVITDTDVIYCNGLRVRLKVFKMNASKLRVYGFAESSSGKSSCLRDGSDFKNYLYFGHTGTLTGDGIKISLGGHSYTAEKKLIKSDQRKMKYVKFDIASFEGEMGFFENNNLSCWATH